MRTVTLEEPLDSREALLSRMRCFEEVTPKKERDGGGGQEGPYLVRDRCWLHEVGHDEEAVASPRRNRVPKRR
ncbi:hypothetical protein M6B38_353455 [Iris pallida]|uniref:Uncharacterized protein n=1 Tax=Iris pallida TaxID=29817 RepID=A0AAX6GQN7_IRIPA|nr:hypothetical protein M6B38_353455 [Iris pallida]